MIARTFRYQDGVLPNCAALGFTLIGYAAGVVLLAQPGWLPKVPGFLLVALTLIWSAYFMHEFAHQTIFRTADANRRWGTLMGVINGSCYAPFERMRRKHMRHHVDRADVITFDVKAFLLAAPAWVRRTVIVLEWAYFPAVEFLMRGVVIVLPFMDAGSGAAVASTRARLRVASIFVARGIAILWFGLLSPAGLCVYFAAYLVFITVLRFADCFQHTYDAYPILDDTPVPQDKVRDKAYEQANTFSDIVGLDNRWLNLLWLNFGFHNAHHERPAHPWHRLPQLHRDLYDDRYAQVITVRELLSSFHRHRVDRLLADDYGQVLPPDRQGRADGFLGAVGVSFLTAV